MMTEDIGAFFSVHEFADSAIHTNSSYQKTPCSVIITPNTELVGDYAESIKLVTTALINAIEIRPSVGDTLLIADGIYTGNWQFKRKLQDDVVVQTWEVVKT